MYTYSKVDAQEISAHNIISADSVNKKFTYIFEPLLNQAQSTYNKLQERISTLNSNYIELDKARNLRNYYTFPPNNSELLQKKVTDLSSALCLLERSWDDVRSDSLDPDFNEANLERPWKRGSRPRPLHLERPEVIAASGKVRKYDYIAAYNFKGFLEALYAITSEIRNITFRVYIDNAYNKGYSVGKKTRFDSYKDMKQPVLDSTTDISIAPHNTEISLLSFNDFILNSNTNGDRVFTPYEDISDPDSGLHGYIGPSLVPEEIQPSLKSHKSYINENVNDPYNFGRQTVEHYTSKNTINWQSKTTQISNFYNSPNRTAKQLDDSEGFPYESDPSSGVAKQYLTLRPAKEYTSDGNVYPTVFETVQTTLSKYFDNNDHTTRIIRSKNALQGREKKKVIITAKAVNDLFKEMNQLVVKILASLCGDYSLWLNTANVNILSSPKLGLGYPMVFSWYYGHIYSSYSLNNGTYKNEQYTTSLNGHTVSPPASREYNGTINNGRDLATEDFIRNDAIRAGFPVLYEEGAQNYISEAKTEAALTKSHSSNVPMTFNLFGIKINGETYTGVKASSAPSYSSNEFKRNMQRYYILPWGSTTMFIPNYSTFTGTDAWINAAKSLYTRYCVSHPVEISSYNQIKNTEYIETSHTDDTRVFPEKNGNTKYLFAPYMVWLNALSKSNRKIYNGKIRNANNSASIAVDISSGPAGQINMAAGIPLVYADRPDIWDPVAITSYYPVETADMQTNPKYGTGQLLLTKVADSTIEKDITKANLNIDWFEYIISCCMTVNEVNHTHSGYSHLDFCVNNGNDHWATVSLDYGNHSTAPYCNSTTVMANSGITSNVYHALNGYNTKTMGGAATHRAYGMTNLNDDLLDMLYGNRFKFNDFYSDWNPLAKFYLNRDNLNRFFIAGGDNDFVQGNATRTLSWVTHVDGTHDVSYFKLNSRMTQTTGYSKSDGGIASHNMMQGNFFANGNVSDKVSIDGTTYSYKYIPQPSPVDVTNVSVSYDGISEPDSIPIFKIAGTCMHFWNNPRFIDIYLQAQKGSQTPTIISTRLHCNLGPIKEDFDFKTQPFVNSFAFKKRIVYDETGSSCGIISASNANQPYDIDLNVKFPELLTIFGKNYSSLSKNCSCTLRIFNENGAFRDICQSKDSVKISDGFFPILVSYRTPEPDKPTTGDLVFDFTDEPPSHAIIIGTNQESSNITNLILPTEVSDEHEVFYPLTEISSNAFDNCGSTLKSITIPTSIKTIDSTAFGLCNKLETVSLPIYNTTMSAMFPQSYGRISSFILSDEDPSITAIPSQMFKNCASIQEINIPGTIAAIKSTVLSGCTSLSNVFIPDSVTAIGNSVFRDCTNLSNINLPQQTQSLGSYVFYGCTKLKSIAIPDTLTRIKNATFYGCSNLKEVDLSETLREISNSAFYNCTELSSINIPDTIEFVGKNAFYGCSSLSSFTIPTTLTTVGENAFSGCTELSTIYFDRCEYEETSASAMVRITDLLANAGITDFNKLKFIDRNPPIKTEWSYSETDNGIIVFGLIPEPKGRLEIPSSFTISESPVIVKKDTIGILGSFSGYSELSAVEIPDTVQFINNKAFTNCSSSIYDVTTSPNYKLVDGWIMDRNTSISNINLGDSTLNDLRGVADYAFQNTNITGISSGNKLPSIPEGLCQHAVNLKEINIGNHVEKICSYAFAECSCTNLTSVDIPANVKDIQQEAFAYCSNIASVNLHDGLETIGEGAFTDCSALQSINIPQTVNKIDNNAFYKTGIQSLIFNNQLGTSELSSIRPFTFAECTGLTNISFSDNIKTLEESAFEGCTSLSSVNLNQIEELKDFAFRNCSNLTMTNATQIPTSVTSIGQGVFAYCNSLTDFILEDENESYAVVNGVLYSIDGAYNSLIQYPIGNTRKSYEILNEFDGNDVDSINGYAFAGCTELSSITIPTSLSFVGESAFESCQIKEINIADLDLWSQIEFSSIDANPLSCPSSSLIFHNSIITNLNELSNDYENIQNYTFANYSKLKTAFFNNNLKHIGAGAFSGCTELSAIYLPYEVTAIDANAFNECTNLKHIIFSNDFEETSAEALIRVKDLLNGSGFNADDESIHYECYRIEDNIEIEDDIDVEEP